MAVDLRSGKIRERRREDGFRFECPVRLVTDTPNAGRFFSSVMNDDAAMVTPTKVPRLLLDGLHFSTRWA